LNWDDFKGDLSLTTVDGSLVPGDYKITYDCHAVSKRGDYKYDTYGKEVVSARAEGSVTFEIVAGCNAVMPAGAGGSEGANSELVKLFLLGSDEFVQAPCAAIADTKENIFRRFDVSPTDGELSFDELAESRERSKHRCVHIKTMELDGIRALDAWSSRQITSPAYTLPERNG
jgi:hypothetical protein